VTAVTFYGRAGCHLCEDALAVLERAHAVVPFQLEIIDIDSDDDLLMRYLERIPVVAVAGQERFEFFVDEREFIEAVANLSRQTRENPPH
jgi:hypothetical protein